MTGKVHRIGVISDTHGMLRAEVVEILKTCEVILHGGDVDRQKILDELRKIAKVYAVRGNNDRDRVELLPETLSFELLGLRIFMIHDRKEITSPEVPAADHDGSDREGGGGSRFPCGADRSGSFNRNVKIDL